jgi:dihydroorotate dehydrogenase electron transfer subunit
LPDHAATAPPRAAERTVAVLENRPIARDTYLLRLDDPAMARAIRPGQFLMVRACDGPPGGTDPLLGRPFALYDVARDADGAPAAVDVVYLVLGRGTATLARRRPGERLTAWGPLGNGFGPPPADGGPVAFVAGGIGQTPFLALARDWLGSARFGEDAPAASPAAGSATLYYGVRSADLFAGLDDFREAGVALRLATDDGSLGHRGFVTDLLAADLERGARPSKVVGCGPPPMLRALAALADRFGLDCDLSLENHMACGFGACFSCVAPIRQPDGSTDLRRVCVEGPVFPARDVAFA